MNSVYENLKALIGTPEYPDTKKEHRDKTHCLRFVHHIGGPIRIFAHAWRDQSGELFATVMPDNVIEFHTLEVSMGTKVMMGKYGLGQIIKSKKVATPYEYWINSLNYRFTVGMKVNLTTNTPVKAATVESIVVDPKLRTKLLKDIKEKALIGAMYLRMSEVAPSNAKIEILRKKTPADFYKAIRQDDTEMISLIPFYGSNRWMRTAPTYDKYPDKLKSYLNSHRSALYEAAGVSS